MAHQDKSREGSEQGRRPHAGQTSQHEDADTQGQTQQGQRGGGASPTAGDQEPKRRDERPDTPRGEHAGAARDTQAGKTQREADELSRGSSDGTPPQGGRSGSSG